MFQFSKVIAGCLVIPAVYGGKSGNNSLRFTRDKEGTKIEGVVTKKYLWMKEHFDVRTWRLPRVSQNKQVFYLSNTNEFTIESATFYQATLDDAGSHSRYYRKWYNLRKKLGLTGSGTTEVEIYEGGKTWTEYRHSHHARELYHTKGAKYVDNFIQDMRTKIHNKKHDSKFRLTPRFLAVRLNTRIANRDRFRETHVQSRDVLLGTMSYKGIRVVGRGVDRAVKVNKVNVTFFEPAIQLLRMIYGYKVVDGQTVRNNPIEFNSNDCIHRKECDAHNSNFDLKRLRNEINNHFKKECEGNTTVNKLTIKNIFTTPTVAHECQKILS